MSFERLNSILKEISASNSYASFRSLTENDLLHQDQEKIVRLCLRKLAQWFRDTPDQIKEIKLHFHQYCLQASHRLKQRQIIDLILEELKTQLNDYFLFLLVDLFEKNYSILLDQLAEQSDVDYLIHLPDRVGNVCMRNIPSCFQIKSYFHRLSEFIRDELINRHYPNLLAQKDTNISFLSQLIHKAAKLGSAEYIWRPLYKTLFLKRCPNDPLWCRIAQYILLEPIDDVLLYTIQHGNAQVLDLLLSDRILHQKVLEIYLTDTLLFRKKLSIDHIRTILVYLTLSSNRFQRCFLPVFHRYLQLWSDERFIRFSSTDQHLLICQSICLCLSLDDQISSRSNREEWMMMVLTGIRFHFESTFDFIRRRGQVLGELIIRRLNLNSSSNELQFHGYDPNDVEVKMLQQLAETPLNTDDRDLSDDDHQEQSTSLQTNPSANPVAEQWISSNNAITLREASIHDDDDDDDSEFESYDCSHDTAKSNVPKPTYIRSCLADLIATDKVQELESALRTLPSLVQLYRIECEEVALELVRILLNYNSTFEIEDFHQLQMNGLVTLTSTYPLMISEYLCKQFYERNYTIQQRSLILRTIQETAKKLSQIDHLRDEIEEKLFVEGNEDDEEADEEENEEKTTDPWRSIINQRLKLKTTYKRKSHAKKKQIFKENYFGQVVGHFFYPLSSHIDEKTSHLSLIDGDQEHLLLCELLASLGRLCIYAQNTPSLMNMLKTFLQLLKSLRGHSDAGVRHALVYAYACSLVSLNGQCHDEQVQMDLFELKQWLDDLILRDTNSEVQKLARAVRQILLKTLHEITNH